MWDENIHFPKKARERGVKNVGGNMAFPPPEAEFLDEIQTKVLRVFLFAIHSNLYSFAYFFKLTQPLTVSRVQLLYTVKEKGGKPE
jgi:hypothetical protein